MTPTPLHDADIAARADAYFNRTRAIVSRFGDCRVTYAVFLRRPVVCAPALMVEWLEAVAKERDAVIKAVTDTAAFTYNSVPTITNVSPNNGTNLGDTAITITGTEFATGATVTVGGIAATNVVVVSSTEITANTRAATETIEDVYRQITAEHYALTKIQLVQQLKQYGIFGMLTKPENLTVATINKYLELKSRGMI